MATLSEEKITEIIEEYKVIKTYSGVARKCGVSPSTVKKYVELNKPKPTIEKKSEGDVIHFSDKIVDAVNIHVPPLEERVKWLQLSKEEIKELNDLRREI